MFGQVGPGLEAAMRDVGQSVEEIETMKSNMAKSGKKVRDAEAPQTGGAKPSAPWPPTLSNFLVIVS